MIFKDISKKIKLFAWVFAIFFSVAPLALAVWFLIAALRTGDAVLRAAGIEGAVLFFVLGLILPMFSFLIYGFGERLAQREREAEVTREMRDLLRQALAEGALSDDISRKLSGVIAKATAEALARAPRAAEATEATPAAPRAAAPRATKGDEIKPLSPVGGERGRF